MHKTISITEFALLIFIAIVIWIIPEPFQKPFRVAVLFFSPFYLIERRSAKIKCSSFVLISAILFVIVALCFSGKYQSSIINIFFATLLLVGLQFYPYCLSDAQLRFARRVATLCCFSIIIQLLLLRSSDGRPKLAYETNLGGAYLFLFFIYCDVISHRFGKICVLISSLFLLSRLLIFSIGLYYCLNFIEKKKISIRLKWAPTYCVVISSFVFFNIWFTREVKVATGYDASINRVIELNDNSNMLRFLANYEIVKSRDKNLIWGYGNIVKDQNNQYYSRYSIMPHNELFDSIAEFGLVLTVLFVLYSFKSAKKLFNKRTYKYFFPVLLYTLILWVRFLVVPSLEMFLFFAMMNIYNNQKKDG